MSLDIDIEDEVKEIIEGCLDAELKVYQHEGKHFLTIDLTWNRQAFAGGEINIDNLINKVESE
jgi:hypothetical protein